MKELKAVLFDLDDTLFDHRNSSREGLRAVWKRYTCFQDLTIDEFELEHLRLLEKIHFSEVLVGKLSLEEARAERFKHAFLNQGVEVDFHTASNAASIYRNNYQFHRRRVKGAEELLRSLHGKVKIGVVSNNIIREQEDKLHYMGFDKYIDTLITSEEIGVTKPDPLIFTAAMERLNVTAEEAVMIGNSWEHDIVGAHAMGLKCIWVNVYDEDCPDASMAAEVESLEDTEQVLNIVKNLDYDL
jgi:putative hydrolase of the HAD superfamily